MSVVFSYSISLTVPESALVGSSVTIRATVLDGETTVQNPACNISIDGQEEQMVPEEESAVYTYVPESPGSKYVFVECYDRQAYADLDVYYPTTLSVSVSPPDYAGDAFSVSATYRTSGGSVVSGASCSADLYIDGSYYETISLSPDGSRTFEIAPEDGKYELRFHCSAPDYEEQERTESFSVSLRPVSITFSRGAYSGYFGSTLSIPFAVDPTYSSCVSDVGTVKDWYGSKKLEVPLDFLGSKKVTVTCSADSRSPSSRTVTVTGNVAPSSVDIMLWRESVYSFQEIRVKPIYRSGHSAIKGTCTVRMGNVSRSVPSGSYVTFRAPPGPASVQIHVSCSKHGYRDADASTYVSVRPLLLAVSLDLPDEVKENEEFEAVVSLAPPVSAHCTLTGRLETELGRVPDIRRDVQVNGSGTFKFSLDRPGKFHLGVNCSAEGYTLGVKEKEVRVLIFSRSEEAIAAIVLTTLTALLALSFVLIRRWI